MGRVCCDAGEGRLNEASVQLEGDVATSKGARVRLDLSRVPSLRIFTGQVGRLFSAAWMVCKIGRYYDALLAC